VFETALAGTDGAAALYARVLAIEGRSWKTRDGVGIAGGPMQAFYARMLPRLCALGQQRAMFAVRGGRDVGYILGAVLDGEYRGLQFSYDDDDAALGIGGLLQYHQIAALCDEGVQRYDLGTEMDYKRRWAETTLETEMLVLVR
jgi:CelD/BcsL family acetyltransferase involved in cellulose biosynthesis